MLLCSCTCTDYKIDLNVQWCLLPSVSKVFQSVRLAVGDTFFFLSFRLRHSAGVILLTHS